MVFTNLTFLTNRTVAHVDADIHHKLANITPEQVMEMQPSLGESSAKKISKTVANLMSLSPGAMPDQPTNRDHHQILARSVYNHGSNEHPGLIYDPVKNHVSTYLVSSMDWSKIPIFKRSFQQNRPNIMEGVPSDDSTAEVLNILNSSDISLQSLGLKKRDLSLMSPIDESTGLATFQAKRSSKIVLFTRNEHQWRHRMVETMEDAWASVIMIFEKIEVSFKV